MNKALTLVRANAKAIVAFVATALVATVGLDVPVDVQLAVSGLVVAVVTWFVPNK
jgi:hypothetical protein